MGPMSESSGIFPKCKMVIRGYFVILAYVKSVPINCQKIVPKVGHGPKMRQNEFELVGHGSIGLLQAQFFFFFKKRTGTFYV